MLRAPGGNGLEVEHTETRKKATGKRAAHIGLSTPRGAYSAELNGGLIVSRKAETMQLGVYFRGTQRNNPCCGRRPSPRATTLSVQTYRMEVLLIEL